MYFGKYDNEVVLKRIDEALKNKKEITECGRAGYDITFSYQPKKKIAFYSEEYKGCGNGHYYLAVDQTHAIFWEND